jgi:hypothetical protein
MTSKLKNLFFSLGLLSVFSLALHPLVHSEQESLVEDEAQVECQLCQNLDHLIRHEAAIDLAANWEQPIQASTASASPVIFSQIFRARAPPQ